MSFIFPSPSTPDVTPLPVAPVKADTSKEVNAMAEMLRKRRGALSTIATSSMGLTETAPTQKAELLSGAGGYG
jgi:hypothetical protein